MLTCWDQQTAWPRHQEVTGLSLGLCADGGTQPSYTWHVRLQRLGTCWDRGQMAGVSQAACPVNDGPMNGPAGCREDTSGEERLKGGARVQFFVLILSVVLIKTFFSLGLRFIFSKKAMAVQHGLFQVIQCPQKRNIHTVSLHPLWDTSMCSPSMG